MNSRQMRERNDRLSEGSDGEEDIDIASIDPHINQATPRSSRTTDTHSHGASELTYQYEDPNIIVNEVLRLSLLNPIQRLLLGMLIPAFKFESETVPLHPSISKICSRLADSIKVKLNNFKSGDKRDIEALTELLKKFYTIVNTPYDKLSSLIDESNIDGSSNLIISATMKDICQILGINNSLSIAEKIANAYYLNPNFALNENDVAKAFQESMSAKEIKKLKKKFLKEIISASVAIGGYPLRFLLPYEGYIEEVLHVHFKRPLRGLAKDFKESLLLKSVGFYFLAFILGKVPDCRPKEREGLNQLAARLSAAVAIDLSLEDKKLLRQVYESTIDILKTQDPQKIKDYEELIARVSRKNWGGVVLGTIFTIASLALIGVCTATTLGLTIPFFSWVVASLAAACITSAAGLVVNQGFFNKKYKALNDAANKMGIFVSEYDAQCQPDPRSSEMKPE